MLLIAIIVPKHLKQFLCIAAGILYLNGVRLFITIIIINIFYFRKTIGHQNKQ